MKRIFILFGFLVAVSGILIAGGSPRKADTKYVFATDSTWPPMEFINENKELVGFDIDLMDAIAKEMGFTAEYVSTGWDGIFAGLINGEYDAVISSVTITDERKQTMDFSDPYFNAGQLLAVRTEDAESLVGLEQLAGKYVGVQIGTTGQIYIQDNYPEVNLKTYDDLGPAAKELALGNIDGIVADAPLIVEYLLRNKVYTELFTAVGEPMTKEEYGVALAKGNTELAEKINEGLAKIRQNGEYDRIYSKWIQ